MELEISPDGRYAAAYTNNNQIIFLNTMISEYIVIDNPFDNRSAVRCETVQGLCLLDNLLVVYGQYTWCVYSVAGEKVDTVHKRHDFQILSMQ